MSFGDRSGRDDRHRLWVRMPAARLRMTVDHPATLIHSVAPPCFRKLSVLIFHTALLRSETDKGLCSASGVTETPYYSLAPDGLVVCSKVRTYLQLLKRAMNRFRKLGFIDYDGGLEVHNSVLNVVLHD